ncbi:hypothetical protein AB1Y20_014387 [Prymnesium parvum]|uniref:EF-hand domain-containing protein n=1 Tax=Prymnesium parvum TaxID=97485 RepID=A0AB34IDJ4_PRYPA
MAGGEGDLRAELEALRARDAAEMDSAELERHQRRKAELKYMLKNNIEPPPTDDSAIAQLPRFLSGALPSLPSIGGAVGPMPTIPNPRYEPPGEGDLQDFAGTVTFGSMMGFCSGYALKKVGRASAATIGVIFMGMTMAEKAGYVAVNWDNVERDVMRKLDRDSNGKVDVHDARRAFHRFTTYMTETNSAVTASTFAAGLLYGLRRG